MTLVELAWRDLPPAHQDLLTNIGASQRAVVDRPLGAYVNDLLIASGSAEVSAERSAELNNSIGVWVDSLRVVVIDAGHPAVAGLDATSYERMIVDTAWHEFGHALSLARAEPVDVQDGPRLLDRAPEGVRERIRGGGYRSGDFTHELVANIYALLMLRRRHGETRPPPWLDQEILELVRRVCGWTE